MTPNRNEAIHVRSRTALCLFAMSLLSLSLFAADPKSTAPETALRLNGEGVALLAKGETEGGLAKLKEALEVDPGCAEAARNVAKLAFAGQRFELAEKVLADALAVHPGDKSLLVPFAQAEAKLGRKEGFEKAIGQLKDTGDAEVLSSLSLLLMAQGNPAEGDAAVNAALAIDGQNAEAYFNKGLIAENQSRWSDAAKCYGRSVRRDPAFFRGWVNLGNVQDRLGTADEAIASYEKALVLEKDNPLAQYNLGRMLVQGKRDVDRGVDLLVAAANNPVKGAAQKAALDLLTSLLAKKDGK